MNITKVAGRGPFFSGGCGCGCAGSGSPAPPPFTCDFTDLWNYALSGGSSPWFLALGDPHIADPLLIITGDDIVIRQSLPTVSGFYCKMMVNLLDPAVPNLIFGLQTSGIGQLPNLHLNGDGTFLLGQAGYTTPEAPWGSGAWDNATSYALANPGLLEIFFKSTDFTLAARYEGVFSDFQALSPFIFGGRPYLSSNNVEGGGSTESATVNQVCWKVNLSDAEVQALV